MTNAMDLLIPTAGVTPGPLYATEISADLGTISDHTHTGASNSDGNQIPTAGLNINADLSMQSNNLVSARTTRFANQIIQPVGSGDVGAIYEYLGDLWYVNGSGQHVQVTSGAIVPASNSVNYSVLAVTANHAINYTDLYTVFEVNSTSNTVALTLPLAATVAGRLYIVKDQLGTSQTNAITILPDGSDTIDQGGTRTIADNHSALALVSDGISNWSLYLYDRKVYSGETLSLISSSILSLDNTSTITVTGNTNLIGKTSFYPGSVITDIPFSNSIAAAIYQNNPTSDVAAGNLTILAQGPFAFASTNKSAGSINLGVNAPNAGGSRGLINLQDAGSTYLSFSSDGSGNALLGGTALAIAPNVTLAGNNSVLSGGSLAINSGAHFAPATGTITTTLSFSQSNATPTITQPGQTTNTATNSISISPQAPYASATSTARIPGSINLALAAPTNGGTVRGQVNITDNSNPIISFLGDSSSNGIISVPNALTISTGGNMAVIPSGSLSISAGTSCITYSGTTYGIAAGTAIAFSSAGNTMFQTDTTGTKLSFFGATPVAKQSAIALSNGTGYAGSTNILSMTGTYSSDYIPISENFASLLVAINQIKTVLAAYGLST
jgi:hypothetical protein